MLENAVRICEAKFGNVLLVRGQMHSVIVATHRRAAGVCRGAQRAIHCSDRPPDTPLGRVASTKQVAHVADIKTDAGLHRATIHSSSPASTLPAIGPCLVVPMLKENELIGAIVIYRQEVRPFTDKQIELVHEFRRRRPSSPSRTPGCSTSCASAPTI